MQMFKDLLNICDRYHISCLKYDFDENKCEIFIWFHILNNKRDEYNNVVYPNNNSNIRYDVDTDKYHEYNISYECFNPSKSSYTDNHSADLWIIEISLDEIAESGGNDIFLLLKLKPFCFNEMYRRKDLKESYTWYELVLDKKL